MNENQDLKCIITQLARIANLLQETADKKWKELEEAIHYRDTKKVQKNLTEYGYLTFSCNECRSAKNNLKVIENNDQQ